MTITNDQKYNVPGLDRALSIIELLNENANGLSVNEVAAILNSRLTAFIRIMSTLERRKYVKKSKVDRVYFIEKSCYNLRLR